MCFWDFDHKPERGDRGALNQRKENIIYNFNTLCLKYWQQNTLKLLFF